jgi:hypothetical protein
LQHLELSEVDPQPSAVRALVKLKLLNRVVVKSVQVVVRAFWTATGPCKIHHLGFIREDPE